MKVARPALFVTVVLLILVACAGSRTVQTPPTEPAPAGEAERDSLTVAVEVFCLTGDPIIGPARATASTGSGVAVGPSEVLTALHVVACPYLADVHVATLDGRRMRAHVVREWPARDVARLEVDLGATHPVGRRLPIVAPELGAPVVAVAARPERGTQVGGVATLEPGGPVCRVNADNGHHWCQDLSYTAVAIGGNSGGPLWDARGRLVGLVTGGTAMLGLPVPVGLASSLWAIRGEF